MRLSMRSLLRPKRGTEPYKNKKEYKADKLRWKSSMLRNRQRAGYADFKMRETAWNQSQENKKNAKKKSSKNSSKSRERKIDRGSGKFDDIRAALREDAGKGRQAASSLRNRNVSRSNSRNRSSSRPMSDPRVNELEGIIRNQKDSFAEQQAAFSKQLADLKLDFRGQLNNYNDEIRGYRGQINDYQGQINDMQASYRGQLSDLRGQLSNSQQLFQAAEAARLFAEQRADNLKRAFVPQANPTATSVSYGDDRQATTQVRRLKDNRLSDLTILSGLGTSSNPLAGLQLA